MLERGHSTANTFGARWGGPDGVIGRSGTEAALEGRGNRAKAGTGVAKREVSRRLLGRRIRQGTVRGDLAPKLVAAMVRSNPVREPTDTVSSWPAW